MIESRVIDWSFLPRLYASHDIEYSSSRSLRSCLLLPLFLLVIKYCNIIRNLKAKLVLKLSNLITRLCPGDSVRSKRGLYFACHGDVTLHAKDSGEMSELNLLKM